MVRLTRQVRFAVNVGDDGEAADRAQLAGTPSNSFGGFPTLAGLGHHFALDVTLAGEMDPVSSYLINIKRVDEQVRAIGVPLIGQLLRDRTFSPAGTILRLRDALRDCWPGLAVRELRLWLTPTLSVSTRDPEGAMVRLSQRFEFSASHRLHNPSLSAEENRRVFGKCNNAHGHGHNYEVQVTLAGEPDANGLLVDVPAFERVVSEAVIDRFDHRNLNVEVPEFRELMPSVENIARVIYRVLKPAFASDRARLASVTVWETPKTWCEYAET